LVDAGDVLEGDLLLRAGRQLRLALAERQRLVAAALHLAHEEDPEADDEQERRPGIEEGRPRADRLLPDVDVDPLFDEEVDQPLVHTLRWDDRPEGVIGLGRGGRFLASYHDGRNLA